MNEIEARAALKQIEEYLSVPRTKEEIDRACATITEINQKYIDYLTELMEEISPEYIPMETQ